MAVRYDDPDVDQEIQFFRAALHDVLEPLADKPVREVAPDMVDMLSRILFGFVERNAPEVFDPKAYRCYNCGAAVSTQTGRKPDGE
jgi:hypothetical protein